MSAALIVVATGIATGVAWACRGVLSLPDITMLYMLSIAAVAAFVGQRPASIAAALSVAAYNFFFLPPTFQFAVEDTRHLLTFAMMFGSGFTISALTARIRGHERDARAREEQTAALYALTREVADATSETFAAEIVARHAAGVFGHAAAVLCPDDRGELRELGRCGVLTITEEDRTRAAKVFAEGVSDGRGLVTSAQIGWYPLRVGGAPMGVLALAAPLRRRTQREEAEFVEAFAQQGALALTRIRFAEEARASALRAQTEEMRSSLLSTVSHDFRTPLAAITGAATTLRDEPGSVSMDQRDDLISTICEEADRLERLVNNLLAMTRVEAGALDVTREWISLEELLASTLSRLDDKLFGRHVALDLPPELLVISVDALLLGQVFANLFDNVSKYTPATTALEVEVRLSREALVIDVADRGPGLPYGSEQRVFDKFFRGAHPGTHGAGLGLSICRGIVEAHGGSLAAFHRPGGGALFRIELPTATNMPPVPMETVVIESDSQESVGLA